MMNKSYSLVPKGVYAGEAVHAKSDQSKAGNPMIVLTIRVLPTKSIVWDRLVLTDRAKWRIARFCHACNISRPENSDDSVYLTLTPEFCQNRTFYCEIVHETFNGSVQAKIGRYLAKEEALAANPDLEQVTLPESLPLQLVAHESEVSESSDALF
jgi:hypothetical protein